MAYDNKKVYVGVQARSTSKRFPRKVFAKLGTSTVLGRVLRSVVSAKKYINANENHRGLFCYAALLVPFKDEIIGSPEAAASDIDLIEGPEDDVLERYRLLADKFCPDYIVRITADCPMIPDHTIAKLIKVGVINGYDYLSNFFEDDRRGLIRLVPDGYECEFFSRRMLYWASDNATDPKDREHVTTIMRTYPEWGKYGVVLPYEDRGEKKCSIDTEDDLTRVRAEHERLDTAYWAAEQKFGGRRVHRY